MLVLKKIASSEGYEYKFSENNPFKIQNNSFYLQLSEKNIIIRDKYVERERFQLKKTWK